MRHIGIEIEFNGLTFLDVVSITQSFFGGKALSQQSYVTLLESTKIGDITIEVDAKPLLRLNQELERSFPDVSQKVTDKAIETVPLEVVLPPISISDIKIVDDFIARLRKKGAKGTFDKFYYAFGVHLNPEILSEDVTYLKHHIQAFCLLSPWLFYQHNVDLVRKIFPFISPYPVSYLNLVLQEDYDPDLRQLIYDYHSHNPTRNCALDMLPVFAYLDEAYTRQLFGDEIKINKRPTFHYRLPNADIENTRWNITHEFNIWKMLEMVANNTSLLHHLREKHKEYQGNFLKTEQQWIDFIDVFFEENRK